MSDSLSLSLDLLKDTYNYNHWIYSLLRPFLGNTVFEIGAGTGNLTRFFLPVEKLFCLEPDARFCAQLKQLAAVHLNMTVIEDSLESYFLKRASHQTDTLICVNVLEHIADDFDAVQKMADMLKPGGSLLLYVPATTWAFGELDRNLGHYRRYSKHRLVDIAVSAKLRVKHLRHVNCLGALGWWWSSRVRKEKEIPPEKARLVDRFVPYLAAIERIIPIPFGQSIFAVFEKAL
jgi:SAM-dependent methyltransferase